MLIPLPHCEQSVTVPPNLEMAIAESIQLQWSSTMQACRGHRQFDDETQELDAEASPFVVLLPFVS